MAKPPCDVLIAGGGVIGSSVAYFLSADPCDRALRVCLVEKDPTFTTSSTALSVGGIRQQFSTMENIRLSLFSLEFFRNARDTLAVEGEVPDLGLNEAGYLFLATSSGRPTMERNHALQSTLGAAVEILDAEALRVRFPWLETADVAAGSLGIRGEGWLDPYSLLQAFRRKAGAQGVEILKDEVVEMARGGGGIEAVRLLGRGWMPVGQVVNAAGPRAARVAALAGIPDLPVRPRKRFVYRIHTKAHLPDCPLVIDPSGVYFRPEGDGFLCGASPPPDQDPDTLNLDMEHDLFYETVWPVLAHRVRLFDSLRLGSSWAGHYAFNPLDQNAILGPHPEVGNFYFANGFSGHGLQHSPGIGRALAELIRYGAYQTLDLGRFRFERFARKEWVREENVV